MTEVAGRADQIVWVLTSRTIRITPRPEWICIITQLLREYAVAQGDIGQIAPFFLFDQYRCH